MAHGVEGVKEGHDGQLGSLLVCNHSLVQGSRRPDGVGRKPTHATHGREFGYKWAEFAILAFPAAATAHVDDRLAHRQRALSAADACAILSLNHVSSPLSRCRL